MEVSNQTHSELQIELEQLRAKLSLQAAQIQQSEERFNLIARASSDAIWDWNLLTDEVWWNEGSYDLFGYAKDQVSFDASWWVEHIHPLDREWVFTDIHQAITPPTTFASRDHLMANLIG